MSLYLYLCAIICSHVGYQTIIHLPFTHSPFTHSPFTHSPTPSLTLHSPTHSLAISPLSPLPSLSSPAHATALNSQALLKQKALQMCEDWHPPLIALLQHTLEGNISGHPAYDRSHSIPSHHTPSHNTPSHNTPSHTTPSHNTPSDNTPSDNTHFPVLI